MNWFDMCQNVIGMKTPKQSVCNVALSVLNCMKPMYILSSTSVHWLMTVMDMMMLRWDGLFMLLGTSFWIILTSFCDILAWTIITTTQWHEKFIMLHQICSKSTRWSVNNNMWYDHEVWIIAWSLSACHICYVWQPMEYEFVYIKLWIYSTLSSIWVWM